MLELHQKYNAMDVGKQLYQAINGAKIPRLFHFVFGLKEQAEPFHLAYYLCFKSCLEVNKPKAIHFYYKNEPTIMHAIPFHLFFKIFNLPLVN